MSVTCCLPVGIEKFDSASAPHNFTFRLDQYRVTESAQTLEKALFYIPKLT